MAQAAKVMKHTQARGRARRQRLLAAARALLKDRDLDQIGISAVADQAGIPVSSAYHFYPDMTELYKGLSREIAFEMIANYGKPKLAEEWEDVVIQFVTESRNFFNSDPAARQLMLGPKAAAEIKHAACREDYRFGNFLLTSISEHFILPPLDRINERFFRAVQIADMIFSLSVLGSGAVTEEDAAEAAAATIAYLNLYLPRHLPVKPSH
ncbi:TetR/AcrR family transcriptional regulator [Croceibacterium soli]|nr:TetR family transcriptional regulator [Croceibacterium soli]